MEPFPRKTEVPMVENPLINPLYDPVLMALTKLVKRAGWQWAASDASNDYKKTHLFKERGWKQEPSWGNPPHQVRKNNHKKRKKTDNGLLIPPAARPRSQTRQFQGQAIRAETD